MCHPDVSQKDEGSGIVRRQFFHALGRGQRRVGFAHPQVKFGDIAIDLQRLGILPNGLFVCLQGLRGVSGPLFGHPLEVIQVSIIGPKARHGGKAHNEANEN